MGGQTEKAGRAREQTLHDLRNTIVNPTKYAPTCETVSILSHIPSFAMGMYAGQIPDIDSGGGTAARRVQVCSHVRFS